MDWLKRKDAGPIGDLLVLIFNSILGLAGMPPMDFSEATPAEYKRRGIRWEIQAIKGALLFSMGYWAWEMYKGTIQPMDMYGLPAVAIFCLIMLLIDRSQLKQKSKSERIQEHMANIQKRSKN